jgi:hypothetical protein
MPCTAHISSALRSVSRWVWWPFKLAATATTLLLLRLLALALRSITPTASTPAPNTLPGNLSDPDDDNYLDDDSLDLWHDYLDDSYVQATCVHHLDRCYHLDPSQHSH